MTYLIGLIVGSVGVFAYADRLEQTGPPVWPRAMISVAAGLLWPVVLVGVAELVLMAAISPARVHTAGSLVDTGEKYFKVRYDC